MFKQIEIVFLKDKVGKKLNSFQTSTILHKVHELYFLKIKRLLHFFMKYFHSFVKKKSFLDKQPKRLYLKF